jgi:hypothetical protein
LPKRVETIVKNKDVYILVHLLVILYISDNARYKNITRFCICCRFEINLQSGPKECPEDDVALHVNPRFNENQIVRNTLQKKVWGVEERHGDLPLARDQEFEILILCEPTHYKVHFKEKCGYFVKFSDVVVECLALPVQQEYACCVVLFVTRQLLRSVSVIFIHVYFWN